MKATVNLNNPDSISDSSIVYQGVKSGHFIVKLIKCCLVFIMFEWLVGQTIIDEIGMNIIAFLIGVAFFLLFLIMAVLFKEDLVESMFE